MDSPISRAEHEEFRRRMEEEHRRNEKRISILEENTKQIGSLTTSVEKLAQSIEMMVREQEEQGKRLETLEGRDGEKWRSVVGHIVNTIISLALGGIFTQIISKLF